MAENTVPLTDLTRPQLLEIVEKMQIKGVKDKNMPAIIEAITAEQARLAAARDAGETVEPSSTADTEPPPPPGDDNEDGKPPEPRAQQQQGKVMGEPLTIEQREKMRTAATPHLVTVLGDPDLPLLWRNEFQREVDRRVYAEGKEDERRLRTSKIDRFEITKGGPFVVDGRVTALRTGGVISPLTHDLTEVARQGIEFETLNGKVVISSDSMGFATSHIHRAPKDVPKATGDAPQPPAKP